MATKKVLEKRIPRVTSVDVHPVVGEAAEKLKAVVPVFGEELVKALVSAIKTEQVRHGELELSSLSDPKQKIRVSFDNAVGSKDISVKLTGDWNQVNDISLDNPLFSPVRGIVYRKRQPIDEKPIVEEGEFIEPGGAICAISQTKSNIWYLQLPLDKFPKGGIVTKFVVDNGREVEKNGTICYVKKVE